jgi:hypothetical protein
MPVSNIQDPLLLGAVIGLYVLMLVCLLYIVLTRSSTNLRQQSRQIEALSVRLLDHGQALSVGLSGLRDEISRQANVAREDSAARIAGVGQDVAQKIDLLANAQRQAFDGFSTIRALPAILAPRSRVKKRRQALVPLVAWLQSALASKRASKQRALMDLKPACLSTERPRQKIAARCAKKSIKPLVPCQRACSKGWRPKDAAK